ncbi:MULTISPECIES: molybdate ABC transporter substrate-binding protein [unclassified Nocardioides]|uniref:molybdate ABC transporter substrate-binding protein n=1 Tax=unclassified Nocardioides TaxID=2615069 RepID=UPI002404E196|nr:MULTISPECIES: molybdate ABC transporter substrate-binding protein [unclassified Nocardioides]MDF9716971.1 molybdate ABC transporter substrate-binding protein [Nocardioides sp. ChNu-99]
MPLPRTRRPLGAALAALVVLPLAACGSDAGTTGGDDARTLTVLAAASLTGTFTELAEQFEAEHEGVSVDLVLDSSGTLADQAAQGAPGDVLATADTASMERAGDARADDPAVFATNELVLVTPAANPAGVTGIASLDDDAVTYVVCVETAPCGVLAAQALADAGVTREPASLERDVKATLARVSEDEADAGLVYRTDARAAGADVATFDLPGSLVTAYPVTTLAQSAHPDLAAEFVDLVLSEAGADVLGAAGFGPP